MRLDAAVHFQFDVGVHLVNHLPRPRDFGRAGGNVLLAPEARVDRHDEQQVNVGQNLLHRYQRRGRVEGHTSPRAQLLDALHGTVKVHARLHVDGDDVRPRPDEVFQVAVGLLNHQVNVQQHAPAAGNGLQGLDNERPNGNVGDEVAVHHVHVQPLHPGVNGLVHLLAQAGEVSRQNGRRQFHLCHAASPRFPVRLPQPPRLPG